MELKTYQKNVISDLSRFIDNISYEMISVLPQGAYIFTGVASNLPVLVQVDLYT